MKSIQLNINHPDKIRAEAFLNTINEAFEILPFDWKLLEHSNSIVDAVRLTNISKSLTVTIIFVEAYEDADLIAKANFLNDKTRWGCNGSIMYLVESSDNDKTDDILSTFAGRE